MHRDVGPCNPHKRTQRLLVEHPDEEHEDRKGLESSSFLLRGSGWTFLLHVSRKSRPAFEFNSFPSASLACEWGMNIALQSSALGS